MSTVFISYAHSPGNKEIVTTLTETLRNRGLKVVVDLDVQTAAGPTDGWPRWMNQQIKTADWVLLLFDGTYRSRFDGDAEKGTGVDWEGLIITNSLYRDIQAHERFVPLRLDDGSPDIISPIISGATQYSIPSESEKLAEALIGSAPSEPKVDLQGLLRVDLDTFIAVR